MDDCGSDRGHARPEVIEVFKSLPERPYPAMRDMWTDLAHIPIGE